MAMTIDREDLELSLLRTFLAVVRHGSEGRAAAEVAKTQAAVSQRILRLEKIIGCKLFSRSRNGVKLTGHGELLVAYARRALELNDEALARLREGSISVPVRLGVSEETVLARLTPALAASLQSENTQPLSHFAEPQTCLSNGEPKPEHTATW
jgi:DNA-binding transcriptional LysR family regulator